jgi:hypothetical protein
MTTLRGYTTRYTHIPLKWLVINPQIFSLLIPIHPIAICDIWIIYGLYQWEFQDPKMEVPTIYKAYIRPM